VCERCRRAVQASGSKRTVVGSWAQCQHVASCRAARTADRRAVLHRVCSTDLAWEPQRGPHPPEPRLPRLARQSARYAGCMLFRLSLSDTLPFASRWSGGYVAMHTPVCTEHN